MIMRHGPQHAAHLRSAHQEMQKMLLDSMRNAFEEEEITEESRGSRRLSATRPRF